MEKKKKMSGVLKALIWIVAILVVVGIFAAVIIKNQAKGATYELLSATPNDTIVRTSILTGAIQPRDEVLVKPQMSGIVAELLHLPGDMVQEGDLVARIKMVPDVAGVQNALSQVERARVALRTAKDVYERDKALFDQGILAKEKYEQSKGSYDQSVIDLSSAQEQYELASKGSSASTAKQNNTLVRATVTGTILEQPVKVGTSVIQANNFNDGTTIVSIADLTDLLFVGDVNESDVNNLVVGADVVIKVGAIPDHTYKAVVEYVSPKGVDKNGTIFFEVKAAIDPANLTGLRAGLSSNAEVELDRRNGVTTIPESAVSYRDGKAIVYVAKTGSGEEKDFEEREVTLGLSDGLNVEVVKGLKGGEQLRGNLKSK